MALSAILAGLHAPVGFGHDSLAMGEPHAADTVTDALLAYVHRSGKVVEQTLDAMGVARNPGDISTALDICCGRGDDEACAAHAAFSLEVIYHVVCACGRQNREIVLEKITLKLQTTYLDDDVRPADSASPRLRDDPSPLEMAVMLSSDIPLISAQECCSSDVNTAAAITRRPRSLLVRVVPDPSERVIDPGNLIRRTLFPLLESRVSGIGLANILCGPGVNPDKDYKLAGVMLTGLDSAHTVTLCSTGDGFLLLDDEAATPLTDEEAKIRCTANGWMPVLAVYNECGHRGACYGPQNRTVQADFPSNFHLDMPAPLPIGFEMGRRASESDGPCSDLLQRGDLFSDSRFVLAPPVSSNEGVSTVSVQRLPEGMFETAVVVPVTPDSPETLYKHILHACRLFDMQPEIFPAMMPLVTRFTARGVHMLRCLALEPRSERDLRPVEFARLNELPGEPAKVTALRAVARVLCRLAPHGLYAGAITEETVRFGPEMQISIRASAPHPDKTFADLGAIAGMLQSCSPSSRGESEEIIAQASAAPVRDDASAWREMLQLLDRRVGEFLRPGDVIHEYTIESAGEHNVDGIARVTAFADDGAHRHVLRVGTTRALLCKWLENRDVITDALNTDRACTEARDMSRGVIWRCAFATANFATVDTESDAGAYAFLNGCSIRRHGKEFMRTALWSALSAILEMHRRRVTHGNLSNNAILLTRRGTVLRLENHIVYGSACQADAMAVAGIWEHCCERKMPCADMMCTARTHAAVVTFMERLLDAPELALDPTWRTAPTTGSAPATQGAEGMIATGGAARISTTQRAVIAGGATSTMHTLETLEPVITAADVTARAGAGGAEAAVSAPVTSYVAQFQQERQREADARAMERAVEDVARGTDDAMHGWRGLLGETPRWLSVSGPLSRLPNIILARPAAGRPLLSAVVMAMAITGSNAQTPLLMLAAAAMLSWPASERPKPEQAQQQRIPHAAALQHLQMCPSGSDAPVPPARAMCHALNVSIALEEAASVGHITMVLRDAVRAREQSAKPRLIDTIASGGCRYDCFLLRDEGEWSMLYNDGGWRHVVLSNPFPPEVCTATYLMLVCGAACEYIGLVMATVARCRRQNEAARRAYVNMTLVPPPYIGDIVTPPQEGGRGEVPMAPSVSNLPPARAGADGRGPRAARTSLDVSPKRGAGDGGGHGRPSKAATTACGKCGNAHRGVCRLPDDIQCRRCERHGHIEKACYMVRADSSDSGVDTSGRASALRGPAACAPPMSAAEATPRASQRCAPEPTGTNTGLSASWPTHAPPVPAPAPWPAHAPPVLAPSAAPRVPQRRSPELTAPTAIWVEIDPPGGEFQRCYDLVGRTYMMGRRPPVITWRCEKNASGQLFWYNQDTGDFRYAPPDGCPDRHVRY